MIDLVVQHRVTGCALFHEFREDASFIGSLPLTGHLIQDQLAHGFPLPVGNNRLLIRSAGRWLHAEGGLFAAVQDVEILQAVTAQLGEGRRRLGCVPLFPDDQLARVDLDVLMLQEVGEGFGAAHRLGHQPGFLLVKRRQQLGPLAGERFSRIQ